MVSRIGTRIAIAIYLLVLVAKVMEAARLSFWSDEMNSLFYASEPSWRALFWDNSPPLFTLLLRFWLKISSSEIWIRLLPLIFSALTPLVIFQICRRYLSSRAAPFALAIASVYAVSFYYATETRPYSLFEFFAATNLYFFLDAMERGRISKRYAASSTFLLLSHYFALLPLGAQVPFLYKKLSKRKSPGLFLSLAGALLLFLAICFYAVRMEALQHLALRSAWELFFLPFTTFKALCLHSNSMLLLFTLALYFRSGRVCHLDDIVLISALGALAIALATGLNPAQAKYFIFLIPYMILILAEYAASLRKEGHVALFLAAVLALNAWSIRFKFGRERAGWAEAARHIPTDHLLFLVGHPALRTPYFVNHKTELLSDPARIERMDANALGSKELWFLHTGDTGPRILVREGAKKLEARGFRAVESGVFGKNSLQPVFFSRLERVSVE